MKIEVNTHAKAYAFESIEINASLNEVYSLIASINYWPNWFEGVSKMHIQGIPEEGKIFIWKANGYKIKSKIHTLQLNSEIGWTGKIWWIRAIHNWQFESLPNGNTKVNVKECFEGFGASLMKKTLKNTLKKDLLILKKEAEKQ